MSSYSGRNPDFLITIDTEGDNLWSTPREITTDNAAYLGRFDSLCESYGLKPTHLVNYEMANSSVFVDFGKDVLHRKTAEIGMHLHAWNTPPLVPVPAILQFVFGVYTRIIQAKR